MSSPRAGTGSAGAEHEPDAVLLERARVVLLGRPRRRGVAVDGELRLLVVLGVVAARVVGGRGDVR